MTQYEKAIEIHGTILDGTCGSLKEYCPSDLLNPYKDLCGDNHIQFVNDELCEKCWNSEVEQ